MNEATQASIGPVVAAALAEDVGAGDLTAQLVDENAVVGAQVIAREPLVVCGEAWVDEVFRQLDDTVIVDWYIGDGGAADGGAAAATVGAGGPDPEAERFEGLPDMNDQMIEDVRLSLDRSRPIHFHCRLGGMLVSPEEVIDKVKAIRAGTSEEVQHG